ncbi:hypothetical protein O6H91_09G045900 [Diphasiastrum complanatum]|uniref:Uncharacterized protein n=1 Tax=Diphasiastrum complanatum TaxID=34168 RepID=A0ACC2CNM9_DIPCM|nr:hypothetical protein O6H91_09G045900 [Diphasiastrum complanatum]
MPCPQPFLALLLLHSWLTSRPPVFSWQKKATLLMLTLSSAVGQLKLKLHLRIENKDKILLKNEEPRCFLFGLTSPGTLLLAESLMCFGASSCSIEEATVDEFQEKEMFSTGPSTWEGQTCQLWDQSCITVLFAPELDVGECIAWAVDSIGLREMPAYTIEEADDQDWIQKVQDVFRPVEVASGLWIVPRWCVPPDPAAINVMLDPGLAFGTGDHPTTRLCLRWLHQNIKGGEHILDYGTGSGILSITALKIGARKAAGVDIDPMAISSAQANALINNLDSCKLQVFLAASNEDNPPPFERFKFDIVVANILMLPLLQLVERITNYAKPGGRVAVSGIVTDQVDKVVASYSVHLENVHVWEDDGWACVSGTRKV